jgi:3D (Asp-Asp-Asp) domain-containing protein
MRSFTRAFCCALACVLLGTGLGLTQNSVSTTVMVGADRQTYQVSSSARTVGDLLIYLGITLGDLDRTTPSLTAPLADGMKVRVTRVTRARTVEEEKLVSQTVVLPAPGRPVGFSKTVSKGRDGLVRRVVETWKKDGEVSRRNVVSEKVVVKPSDTVILRGGGELASRGGNWHRKLRMEATAYDPGPRSCGKYADGYTANGTKATKGVCAVDTRIIPFGTRLYIPGYGLAIAADRGSAIKGNRIDLCFDTYAEAVRFGRKMVDVYILR